MTNIIQRKAHPLYYHSWIIAWVIAFLLIAGCGRDKPADPGYLVEIDQWHAGRVERLTAPGSWLSLAGLFWLAPGENSFGSAADNMIVFPENAPPPCGAFPP